MPTTLGRLSRTLALLFSDGLYVVAFPTVGAFLPPILLVVATLLGWLHPLANGELYSGSLILLLLLALPGQFGAAFGAWTLLGYVLGDFLLSRHPNTSEQCFGCGVVGDLVQVRGPMLLSYVLLFGLIVFTPFLATTLRRLTLGRLDDGSPPWLVIRAALQGVLQGALVLVWTNAYPPLIRPIFTWVGSSPNIEVIQPVQAQGGVLVAVGVLGGVARALVEGLVPRLRPTTAAEIASLRTAIVRAFPSRSTHLPFLVSALLGGAFLTFLISGVIGSWIEGALLFAVFTGSFVLRRALWRVPAWTAVIRRVPLLLRLVVGVVVSYAIATLVLEISNERVSFFPLVLSTALSVIVMALLLPSAAPPDTKAPDALPVRQPDPSKAPPPPNVVTGG